MGLGKGLKRKKKPAGVFREGLMAPWVKCVTFSNLISKTGNSAELRCFLPKPSSVAAV